MDRQRHTQKESCSSNLTNCQLAQLDSTGFYFSYFPRLQKFFSFRFPGKKECSLPMNVKESDYTLLRNMGLFLR